MIADGKRVSEVISIDGWSIITLGDRLGTGISHQQCESWTRYGMHPNFLVCPRCKADMPEGIVGLWALLNADTIAGIYYWNLYGKVGPNELR